MHKDRIVMNKDSIVIIELDLLKVTSSNNLASCYNLSDYK